MYCYACTWFCCKLKTKFTRLKRFCSQHRKTLFTLVATTLIRALQHKVFQNKNAVLPGASWTIHRTGASQRIPCLYMRSLCRASDQSSSSIDILYILFFHWVERVHCFMEGHLAKDFHCVIDLWKFLYTACTRQKGLKFTHWPLVPLFLKRKS